MPRKAALCIAEVNVIARGPAISLGDMEKGLGKKADYKVSDECGE